ncbi:MAG: GNAT family N-acetyltransferase [Aureliella sp.]
MHNDYEIRPASPDDIMAVTSLLKPLVDQRRVLRRTKTELSALMQTGFVVVKDGQLVGFCAVEIYSKKLAEIQCLVVDSHHRQQGLGGQLVTKCVDLAKQRNVMEVMAISASEKFLQDLGFDYSLPDQKRALFYQLRTRDSVYEELEGNDDI